MINNMGSNKIDQRFLEMEKSIKKIILIQNQGRLKKMNDVDAQNQYTMNVKFEVSRLRKLGFIDVTEEELHHKVNAQIHAIKATEIEKSVITLIKKKKEIDTGRTTGIDSRDQYTMAVNLEVTKLRKLGYDDVTTDGLNTLVEKRMQLDNATNQFIQNMEQAPSVNIYGRQRGYTVIGILGLITSIVAVGLIIYGYIVFYR